MLAMVQPLHVGNALRLFIEPPSNAISWRILRKTVNAFASEVDPTALIAYEGNDHVVLDTTALVNGVMAFYQPYYYDGAAWTAGAGNYGTPAANYTELTPDVLSILRERLEAGLLVEVQRGNLISALGYVQVINGAPTLEGDMQFPLVTVHMDSEEAGERGLGESFGDDFFDSPADLWREAEGWLANVRVTIVGWSLNADERIELRKAIRRILIGNLPTFDARGLIQVQVSQQDVDAVGGEYPAPLFQVMTNFSCTVPVRVGGAVDPITDVTLESL